MDIGRAKAIAEVAGRIIDSAKVEVDFMRVAKRQVATDFIPIAPRPQPTRYGGGALPAPAGDDVASSTAMAGAKPLAAKLG